MNTEMVFDPSVPNIDKNYFQLQDYIYSIYSSPGETLQEALPLNMQKTLVTSFIIHNFVDADYAGRYLTQRSRTGFIIFLNNALIYWYTKKH